MQRSTVNIRTLGGETGRFKNATSKKGHKTSQTQNQFSEHHSSGCCNTGGYHSNREVQMTTWSKTNK